MTLRRVHLRIEGLVQGVSYRASARQEALRLGLTGWVRNLDRGEVEAVAEGPSEAIERFVAWCRQGPSESRVDGVSLIDELSSEGLVSFEVRR
jgi:acylphosphatase